MLHVFNVTGTKVLHSTSLLGVCGFSYLRCCDTKVTLSHIFQCTHLNQFHKSFKVAREIPWMYNFNVQRSEVIYQSCHKNKKRKKTNLTSYQFRFIAHPNTGCVTVQTTLASAFKRWDPFNFLPPFIWKIKIRAYLGSSAKVYDSSQTIWHKVLWSTLQMVLLFTLSDFFSYLYFFLSFLSWNPLA